MPGSRQSRPKSDDRQRKRCSRVGSRSKSFRCAWAFDLEEQEASARTHKSAAGATAVCARAPERALPAAPGRPRRGFETRAGRCAVSFVDIPRGERPASWGEGKRIRAAWMQAQTSSPRCGRCVRHALRALTATERRSAALAKAAQGLGAPGSNQFPRGSLPGCVEAGTLEQPSSNSMLSDVIKASKSQASAGASIARMELQVCTNRAAAAHRPCRPLAAHSKLHKGRRAVHGCRQCLAQCPVHSRQRAPTRTATRNLRKYQGPRTDLARQIAHGSTAKDFGEDMRPRGRTMHNRTCATSARSYVATSCAAQGRAQVSLEKRGSKTQICLLRTGVRL